MSFDHGRILSACSFRHEAYVIEGEKFNSSTHAYHHFDSRLKLSTGFSTWTEAASVRGTSAAFEGRVALLDITALTFSEKNVDNVQ